MTGERASDRSCRGFTLLEVLAALVILALSLGALFQLFSTSLRGLGAAENYATAGLLAESWLGGLGTERPIVEGEARGAFDDRFHWRAVVTPVAAGERTSPVASPVRAYEVELMVHWNEVRGERSISLSTLRLVPNP
jgi:general secretion pathway protein I